MYRVNIDSLHQIARIYNPCSQLAVTHLNKSIKKNYNFTSIFFVFFVGTDYFVSSLRSCVNPRYRINTLSKPDSADLQSVLPISFKPANPIARIYNPCSQLAVTHLNESIKKNYNFTSIFFILFVGTDYFVSSLRSCVNPRCRINTLSKSD